MKKLLFILFALIGLTIQSQAGFIIKKAAPATVLSNNADAGTISTSRYIHKAEASATEGHARKHSFISRMVHKLEDATVSKGVYVLLALIGFGWLAMGLNDNFEGFNWVLSLILYILGYLPGLIYTLIMMGDYY